MYGGLLLTIMIPAFNEEKTIEANIKTVSRFLDQYEKNSEILIVDDGSTDSTHRILSKLVKTNKRVRVLNHQKNMGIGAALRTGLRNAKGDIIITMDSDLSYPPEDIPKVIDMLKDKNADIVIGSPYAKGGDVSRMPFLRLFLSRSVNLMDQVLFRLNFTTPSCFFRAWKKEAAKTVKMRFDRFEAVSESAINAHRQGYKIVEIPVTYRDIKGRKSRLKIIQSIKKHIEMDLILLFS
jgi:dolichol-phosphate mannosyltransferase